MAAVAGVGVAAVQVEYYLHLRTKKSRDRVAVQGGRSNPGPGVAWHIKVAITSKRTLGRVEKFGILPPRLPFRLASAGRSGKSRRGLFFCGGDRPYAGLGGKAA